MDFRFRDIQRREDIGRLCRFLLSQDLGYPNYSEWVDKAEAEIERGYKKAILCFYNGSLVGDLIFQEHKQLNEWLELKNMRVHPELRDRCVARFMLRQAEVYARQNKFDAIICDAPAREEGIVKFMESENYMPILVIPIYTMQNADVVMIKFINQVKKPKLISGAQRVVLANAA